MATPTKSPDDQQRGVQNPGDTDYNRRFNEGNFEDRLKATPSQDEVEKGLRDLENTANGGEKNSENSVRQQEQEPASGIRNNYTGKSAKEKLSGKIMTFAKKRGWLVGGGAGATLIAILFAGIFGSTSMMVNVMENFVDTNDSTTTAMERRILKVLGFSTTHQDPICQNNTKITLKCKSGRISNKALSQLEKKGITPLFPNGVTNDTSQKYPPRNPTGYRIVDGTSTTDVDSANLARYLSDNPRIAVKVLGTGGAFNVTMRAWSGQYMFERFFQKFGLFKNGGLADGQNKRLSAAERSRETLRRLSERLPGVETLNNATEHVRSKVSGHLNKAAKGGVGYTLAVAGCIVPKAPAFVAAGIAAAELAPILVAVNDVNLSPASRIMASGVDTANAVTPEDVEMVSSLYTDKHLDEGSGKMLSAVDSPYLQSAMGVNKNKVTPSAKFSPGFAYLTSSVVIEANKVNKALEPTCNAVMSPAAMYTALAVDSAATIALSTTLIGGVVKVAASIAIQAIVGAVVEQAVAGMAEAAIAELADPEKYNNAKGKELGDVLGLGAMAYFSSGAMARHLPGLKMSQLSDVASVQQDSENFRREMAIASLSPFDISSKYTFLGSIVHNAHITMATTGFKNTPLSVFSALTSLPTALTPTSANAADNFSQNYCGYAREFGLEVGVANTTDGSVDTANTPAINAAGLPCTGITQQQASMSTEEAIDLMLYEGWIDPAVEDPNESMSVGENDSITDLIEKGIIKADTPLTDFIESCGSAETGDYLFNAAGCTSEGSTKSTAGVTTGELSDGCYTNEDGETSCASDDGSGYGTTTEGVKDPRSLQAISVFLLDYQLITSINGEDEQNFREASAEDTEYVLPVDPGYASFSETQDWGSRDICESSNPNSYCKFHRGVDFAYGSSTVGKPVYSVADGEVIEATLYNTSCEQSTSGDVRMDNRVLIRHTDGTITGYSHMTTSSIEAAGIKVGEKVTAGKQIGTIGNCGNSQGAHLHFTVNPGNSTDPEIAAIDRNVNGETFIDPVAYMALYGVDLTTGTYTDGR